MIALLCLFASRVRCSYALVTAALVVVVAGTTGRQLSQQRACDTGNARAMLQQMITRTTVTSSIPMRQCVGESNAYFANWRVVVPRLSRADHIAVVSFMDDYGLIDDDAASPIAVTREYEIEASSFDDETTLVVFRRR